MIDVNAHLHTPYSFSAFSDVKQALDMAASEGVKVVGINDFYSMDGYREWKEGCAERALFPLFGIEFISLNAEDQAAGLRVNDPNNPAVPISAARVWHIPSFSPEKKPANLRT